MCFLFVYRSFNKRLQLWSEVRPLISKLYWNGIATSCPTTCLSWFPEAVKASTIFYFSLLMTFYSQFLVNILRTIPGVAKIYELLKNINYSLFFWQGFTANGVKKGQIFVGDISTLYRSGKTTVDVKADTYSNVRRTPFNVVWIAVVT